MDKFSRLSLHTGNKMPRLGLGTWQLTDNTADTVLLALEQGYRQIDTSSDYGTQPEIGEALKRTPLNREEIYLTTKVEEDDDAYDRTQKNLRELSLDYVDLMLIHRPPPIGAGEDLWQGLIRAKKEGLIRDIGVSNYTIDQMEALIKASGETPVVNQIEWSPFGHSQKMLTYCRQKKIIIQAYSPLTRTNRLNDPLLKQVADKYQKTPAQILLRWNLQLGTVPLPKANRPEHIKENLDIFDFEILDEYMDLLNGLNQGYSSLGSLPYV
jgi:2,5-diketo-D-gluconate reductase A